MFRHLESSIIRGRNRHKRSRTVYSGTVIRVFPKFCGLETTVSCKFTAKPPTNIVDFRGSSIILILRGGILTSIGNLPESLSRAMLVGRLGVLYVICCWEPACPFPTCNGQQGSEALGPLYTLLLVLLVLSLSLSSLSLLLEQCQFESSNVTNQGQC